MSKANRSTCKSLDVLDMLARADDGMRLTDIAVGTGFPISTAQRALVSLMDRGYVEQDTKTKRYFLGVKTFTLQASSTRHHLMMNLAYPFLKQLQCALDETVSLGFFCGSSALSVETLTPESSLAFYSPPGTLMPLHCTAIGKLFLAHASDVALAVALNGVDWARHTPQTLGSPKELLETFPEIKRRGYAIDNEEYEPGVRCLAAPIYSYSGQIAAAVSVIALASHQIGERETLVAHTLTQTCAHITKSISYLRA